MKRLVWGSVGGLVLLAGAFTVYVYVRNRPLPQNEYDVPILERVLVLLGTEETWSKEDSRSCDPELPEWSLYCALQYASIDVSGEFHHRAAALQAVRRAIDEVRPENDYSHRLQDFNSDPDVTLELVHEVVNRALIELDNRRD
jgi:hypothetical protein